jgi:hypothetical protein
MTAGGGVAHAIGTLFGVSMADTFYGPTKDAWRDRVRQLLTESGVDITQLAGGSYRIQTVDNLLMVNDLSQLRPGDVQQMLATQARFERTSA